MKNTKSTKNYISVEIEPPLNFQSVIFRVRNMQAFIDIGRQGRKPGVNIGGVETHFL